LRAHEQYKVYVICVEVYNVFTKFGENLLKS
jgi:hypothetical protein